MAYHVDTPALGLLHMTWAASRAPSTRCNMVWRETPRARIDSRIGRRPPQHHR